MAAGLRVWDKATNLEVISTGSSICMPFALIEIGGDGAPNSGSYVNDNLLRGVARAQLLQIAVGPNSTFKFLGAAPVLTISGNTFSWYFSSIAGSNPPLCRVLLSIR